VNTSDIDPYTKMSKLPIIKYYNRNHIFVKDMRRKTFNMIHSFNAVCCTQYLQFQCSLLHSVFTLCYWKLQNFTFKTLSV